MTAAIAILVVVAVLLCLSWLFNGGSNAGAKLINTAFRRHDGGTTDGPSPGSKVGTTAATLFPANATPECVGGPSRVVDASNSPNVEFAFESNPADGEAFLAMVNDAYAERRRLSGLTEVHKIAAVDPVLPPPSRSIRRVH